MRLGKKSAGALLSAILALAGCGGGSSSGGNTFAFHGGKGSDGGGGGGGKVYVYTYGAPITMKKGGGLPALPTWSYTAPELGSNPLTVASDTPLTVGPSVLGDDGVNPATGLWVKSGATLTITPGAGNTATMDLSDGLLVEGKIVLAPISGSLSSTSLTVTATDVAVKGAIEAKGGAATTGNDGGDGGVVTINVSNNFFLTGSMVATGGAGDNGGSGGEINVIVGGPAWAADVTPSTIAVTGLSDTSGGAGAAGAGGDSGDNSIWGEWNQDGACNFYSSGTFRADGGKGTAGGGGGGHIYASSCSVGWAVNTGTMEALSGAATVDGAGGDGNEVYLEACDGVVYAGGKILVSGGAGAGSGNGGGGGDLYIDSPTCGVASAPALGAYVAAALESVGGDGASGGKGGYMEIYTDGTKTNAGITLTGYHKVDAVGGAGTTAGGTGGDYEIYPEDWYDSDRDGNVVGALDTETPIDVRGGVASAGAGGDGGYAWVGTWIVNTGNTLLDPATVSTHSRGDILATGGKGTTTGGEGGQVDLWDATALYSMSSIEASGGAGGTGDGGAGGLVVPYGDGTITITGKITALGGSSASGSGGVGGEVDPGAVSVSLGACVVDGGAAPAGTGGGGGTITLTSSTPPSTVTATLSLRGGAGTAAGAAGTFTMDGAVQTLTDGRYTP